jgi:hypothetical protein
MPLNAETSASLPNIQAQFVATPVTQAASASEPFANQQTQTSTETPVNAAPSAVAAYIQAQSVATPVTQQASAAQPPATQQAQATAETPVNSGTSAAASYIQAPFVPAQVTQRASATEPAATQQANMPTAAAPNGAVAERPRTDVASNRAQIADSATSVSGEIVQASAQAPLPVAFLGIAAVGTDGATAWKQPVNAAALKDAHGTTALKNPTLAKATDANIDNTASTAVGTHNGASAGQNSGQSLQNTNGNSDQAGSVSARVAASSLSQAQTQAQTQTIAASGTSHEIASSAPMPRGLADGSRLAEQAEAPIANLRETGEGAVTTAINSAKLIQAMGQTEMRVGLHTTEYGDISIRTSVSQQQMQAQISLNHPELSQAIAAHISSVQTKLGDEHGIQASIQIDNQGTSYSSDSGQSSQRQQYAFAGSTGSADAADYAETDNGMSLGALAATGNEHRLDIRA